LRIKPIPPVDLAREELFARLSAELRPERITILRRGDLTKVVDAAVQVYLFRNAIEVDPIARHDLTADLIKAQILHLSLGRRDQSMIGHSKAEPQPAT
jgi:hypothetical protein